MGCYISYLPKKGRIISNLRVDSIWTKKEGWDGCAEAQFYDNGEIQYQECTCLGIKRCQNELQVIKYSDIDKIVFEEKWEKKSETNGGQNPSEDKYLFNICYIRLKDGEYYRLSHVSEQQVEEIKIKLYQYSKKNAPPRQVIAVQQNDVLLEEC